MVYDGILWYTMAYDGIQWYIIAYYGILWFLFVCYFILNSTYLSITESVDILAIRCNSDS